MPYLVTIERNTIMRIFTTAATVVVLSLSATTLAACGASDSHASAPSSGYCQELKSDKTYFLSLDSDRPDLTQIDQVFERIHALAAAAPSQVAGDWMTLDTAVTTIEGALSNAGLEPDDLADLGKGEIPEGVDLDKLPALGTKLTALSGTEVNDAADRIAKDAKDSCGFDLHST